MQIFRVITQEIEWVDEEFDLEPLDLGLDLSSLLDGDLSLDELPAEPKGSE